MDSKRTAIVVVLLLVAGAGTAGTTVAAEDYTITLDPAVDTPERPAGIGSETFTVSALGRVDPGETVTAEVSAPEGSYDVVVYDAQEEPVAERNASGDATIEFDTTGWGAGIYLVAVQTDDGVHAVHPLVVSAYHLDVTAPDEATEGSSVPVTAELDPNGEAVDGGSVGAIVANDDNERAATLEAVGEGTFEGSVSLSELPTGEYAIYVVVMDGDSESGEGEILAFSDPRPLTIQADEPTDDEDGADDQDDGDEIEDGEAEDESFDYNHRDGITIGGDEDDGEEEPTETGTPTETPEPTETATPTTTEQEAGNTADDEGDQEQLADEDGPTDEPAGLTSGMTIPAVILAALLVLVLVYRFR